MNRRIFSLLALDLRSLALFRIAFGLVITIDSLIRCTDLLAHYTDAGVAPRSAVLELGWQPEYWSLFMFNGSWPFAALLFALGILASLSMAAGYRTRWATVLTWIHLCSVHSRNPVVMDGGDTYVRCVMFWCMFLPWGARWSIDAYRSRDFQEGENNAHLDVSTVAYMLQMSLIYVVAATLKTGVEWRVDRSATYYALMVDQLATPRAAWLLPYPELMKWLTVGCLWFEGWGPLTFWLGPGLRWLGALGISLLHAGFGFFLHLGAFCLIGMTAPLGLWPGFVFDWLEKTAVFASLRRAGRLLAEAWPLTGCSPARPRPLHTWVTGSLTFLMVYVVVWNLTSIPGLKLPFVLNPVLGRSLRLDQAWNMFAPKPLEEDGWYVIDAEKVSGEHVDLYRDGAPLRWSKPRFVASQYPNARWRKFMMNLWARDLSQWRLYYSRYLTRSWNSSHTGPDQIKTFRIYFMLERTMPDGTSQPVEKVVIWNHICFDQPPAVPHAAAPSPTPKPSEVPNEVSNQASVAQTGGTPPASPGPVVTPGGSPSPR